MVVVVVVVVVCGPCVGGGVPFLMVPTLLPALKVPVLLVAPIGCAPAPLPRVPLPEPPWAAMFLRSKGMSDLPRVPSATPRPPDRGTVVSVVLSLEGDSRDPESPLPVGLTIGGGNCTGFTGPSIGGGRSGGNIPRPRPTDLGKVW